MESNISVDNTAQAGYNDSNSNDLNDFVIKMDEQSPIHDTECKHETLVPDDQDTIGNAVYHGCANDACPVGFYIQTNKNLT